MKLFKFNSNKESEKSNKEKTIKNSVINTDIEDSEVFSQTGKFDQTAIQTVINDSFEEKESEETALTIVLDDNSSSLFNHRQTFKPFEVEENSDESELKTTEEIKNQVEVEQQEAENKEASGQVKELKEVVEENSESGFKEILPSKGPELNDSQEVFSVIESESTKSKEEGFSVSKEVISEERNNLDEEIEMTQELKTLFEVAQLQPPSEKKKNPNLLFTTQSEETKEISLTGTDIYVNSLSESKEEISEFPDESKNVEFLVTKEPDLFENTQSLTLQRKKKTKRTKLRKEKNKQQIAKKKTDALSSKVSEEGLQEGLIFSAVPENVLKGGVTLFNNLIKQMSSNNSLRVESLMSVLGALAGYSTQAAVREKIINRMGLAEKDVFSVITTENKEKYYFCDAVDNFLQKDKHSIWYMTASASMRLTGKVDSNIEEVVRFNMRSIGSEKFGKPRLAQSQRAPQLPKYYVENIWESLKPGLEQFSDDPFEWPLIFGVALQRALICTNDILDANQSLQIILENAVPMSMAYVVPIKPEIITQEQAEKEMIKRLNEDIEVIRSTLQTDVPEEERLSLINELAEKTEKLYLLLQK